VPARAGHSLEDYSDVLNCSTKSRYGGVLKRAVPCLTGAVRQERRGRDFTPLSRPPVRRCEAILVRGVPWYIGQRGLVPHLPPFCAMATRCMHTPCGKIGSGTPLEPWRTEMSRRSSVRPSPILWMRYIPARGLLISYAGTCLACSAMEMSAHATTRSTAPLFVEAH
jgi:hypothetical protein